MLLLPEPMTIAGEKRDRLDVKVFDSATGMAPAGKGVIKVVFASGYAYWQGLATSRERYEAVKEEVAGAVIGLLEQRFPGLARQVEAVDVATPLTLERYTGNWRGLQAWSAPGLGCMFKGVSRTLPGLANFYMAGQWAEDFKVFLAGKVARLPHGRSRRAISKREGMCGLLNRDLLP